MKLELAQIRPGESATSFPGDQIPLNQPSVLIRYKGPFDWTNLYRTMQRWFEQRRFRFYERRIKETGRRIKLDCYAERELDEFFKEVYSIKVEMWHMSKEEVVVNGEPRQIINAMAQFRIGGQIKADWAGYFSGSPFKRWLGNIFMNVRWREIEMKYIDTMEYRTQDIQTMIKECLNMQTKENAAW